MHIPAIETFPETAQRAAWARLLQLDSSTLFRAEQRGELTPIKTRSGRVLYTKATVVAWLNLEMAPVVK